MRKSQPFPPLTPPHLQAPQEEQSPPAPVPSPCKTDNIRGTGRHNKTTSYA